jgi:hydroxymethylglutaryl-CoA lyase
VGKRAGLLPELVGNQEWKKNSKPAFIISSPKELEIALANNVEEICFSLSVSESYSQANRKFVQNHNLRELTHILSGGQSLARLRVNLEACFDCPYEGLLTADAVFRVIDKLASCHEMMEFCLCDTTGRATPDRVETTFSALMKGYCSTWAFCANNSYGLGLANVVAAFHSGVNGFATALGGLGGNLCHYDKRNCLPTEDVVFMFEKMSVNTGINLEKLLVVVDRLVMLEGKRSSNGFVSQMPRVMARI